MTGREEEGNRPTFEPATLMRLLAQASQVCPLCYCHEQSNLAHRTFSQDDRLYSLKCSG